MKKNHLTGMGFTLVCDRPVNPQKHYLSPGGYSINGKSFDFCSYRGERVKEEPHKVFFEVDDFDDEYAEDNEVPGLTREDVVTGEFDEFCVNTGEYDDEEIHVVGAEDLSFEFDYKTVWSAPNDSRITKSATSALAKG